MREPTISIVTINFQQDEFIWEAVESVRNQSFTDWEHIIVDAGRTDVNADFYGQLIDDDRYLIICEPDMGPADGLNKGLAVSRGRIFGYINADDYYISNDAFAEAISILDENPDMAGVLGAGVVVSEQGVSQYRVYSDRVSVRAYLVGAAVAVQQSTFLRMADAKQVGFNKDNKVSWDGELLLWLAHSGRRFITASNVWGAFRMYPNSITGSGVSASGGIAERRRMYCAVYGKPPGRAGGLESCVRRIANVLVHPRRICSGIRSRMFRHRYL